MCVYASNNIFFFASLELAAVLRLWITGASALLVVIRIIHLNLGSYAQGGFGGQLQRDLRRSLPYLPRHIRTIKGNYLSSLGSH